MSICRLTHGYTFKNLVAQPACRIDSKHDLQATDNPQAGKGALTNSLQHCGRFVFTFLALTCCGSNLAQTLPRSTGNTLTAAFPDAPLAQTPAQPFASATQHGVVASLPPARRYAQVIEPGQKAYELTAPDKLVFSFTEVTRPITLLPGLYSASYEQLFNTDPKYGHDAGAYGEKFGAAMLRSASVRVFSDGIFAGAFHQDPRYYRIAQGSLLHRGLLSARQAIIRRGDDGNDQFNYSGIAGRAVAAALVATYYPEPSVTGKVVGLTFATSIASDAGGNLVLEFLPNIIRKFPVMQKLRIE
jgi:hypothetical protein